jgi:hypothetical protein
MSIWAISPPFGLTRDFYPETRLDRATLAARVAMLAAQPITGPMS